MLSKNPRVIAQIDKNAIIHNYKTVKESLPKGTKIMSVVKADGYGHGAVELAKALERENADYFAVAVLEEALELKNAGIKTPILIFGYTPQEYMESIVSNNLTQTIVSYEMAKNISDEALRQGKTAKVHINIDTGMGRIGFLPNSSSIKNIEKISKLKGIEIEGIYTHFSSADEKDNIYTKKQASSFDGFLQNLKDLNVKIPIVHLANSAAILAKQSVKYDMVRLGIALYGYYPSKHISSESLELIPSMSIKTQVVHVKTLSKNNPIGYNRTYTTNKPTKIATIPIGYADGYSRGLSNKGRVLIKGEFAPIIGNICMDQFMVDITNIDKVNIGDQVILVGSQKDNKISMEEIAEKLGTINYEVICMIGKRIPRIYV